MEKYSDVEFLYNSVASHEELRHHFKQICEIYSDAKICFDYAYALKYPEDESHSKLIEDFEPLRMLRYTSGRLALIELTKLYQKKDHLCLIKFINRIQCKYYGVFKQGNYHAEELAVRFENIIAKNSKVLGLRDKIFAHADKKSEIRRTKVYETGYSEVKQFFASTFDLIDDLHELLSIAPYHKINNDRPFNPQLFEIIKLL
jgi:hypothetical protein